MRKLAILTFQTLDGVMQSPTSPQEDPSYGFDQGGWAMPFWEEVMEQVSSEAMAEPYDLLLGRKTYDIFAPHWSQADDPIALKLNAATKYVVTTTAFKVEWANSVPITGDVAVEIARLKEGDGPLLQVHGSWRLIQTLLSHNLIDEYRLWTFPVTVGSGKRLFANGGVPQSHRLIKSAICDNGTIMTIYHRA